MTEAKPPHPRPLGRRIRLTSGPKDTPGIDSRQSNLMFLPYRPRRVTDALHRLAESNPTPAEYEMERARILEGDQA